MESAEPGAKTESSHELAQGSKPPKTRKGIGGRLVAHRKDVLGLMVISLFALAYLAPALSNGQSFGPADLGRGLSVLTTTGPSAVPNHNVINGDIITQGVAWNTLDWNLVHHGQVPLWDSLSGTGIGQLLNFESAPFALPTLFGYLFPLGISFLVTVLMKLLIAGTGAYLLTRLLGGRVLAATFAGITFMLSGSLAGWLGWSVSGPLVFVGWIMAGIVLCYRSNQGKRTGPVALLGFSLAWFVYGGFPETNVLVTGTVVVWLGVVGLIAIFSRRSISLAGVRSVVLGVLTGLGLSFPLWAPGVSILKSSVRNGGQAAAGLPLHALTLLFAQGYDGLPLGSTAYPHGTFFGPVDYFETAAYVGVLALVLAGVAVVTSWRRPVIAGFTAVVAACVLVVYDLGQGAPIQHLIKDMGLGAIAVQRALPLLGFAIAVLSGLGLELLLSRWHDRSIQLGFAVSTAGIALVLVGLWVKADSPAVSIPGTTPPSTIASAAVTAMRRGALSWPVVEIAVLALAGVVGYFWSRREKSGQVSPDFATGGPKDRSQVAKEHKLSWFGAGLVVAQGAFLVFAGAGINSYSSTAYPVTPAVAALKHIVGGSLVGLDAMNESCGANPVPPCGLRQWEGIGLYPDMNIGYGVSELAMHDPTIPKAYFDAFPIPNNDQAGGGTNIFAPSIDSVALARLYGVKYVIIQPPLPVPAGMRMVSTIVAGGVHLKIAFVPGSGRFGFVGSSGHQTNIATDAVVQASHPSDVRYEVTVRAPIAETLAIRITDVPGWHATADGRPIGLDKGPGDLMEAVIPARTQVVELTYAPRLLEVGYGVAAATLVVLAGSVILERRRRSHRKTAAVS